MNSKDTLKILREIAVQFDIPLDEARRICRSQFEWFAACVHEVQSADEVKRYFLPELFEFSPVKKRTTAFKEMWKKQKEDNKK